MSERGPFLDCVAEPGWPRGTGD